MYQSIRLIKETRSIIRCILLTHSREWNSIRRCRYLRPFLSVNSDFERDSWNPYRLLFIPGKILLNKKVHNTYVLYYTKIYLK